MTSTFIQATTRLRVLLEGLEDGSWEPRAPERTCAAAILNAPAGTPPVAAVLGAMRAAGPGIALAGEPHRLFVEALVKTAVLLRSEAFTASKEGQDLLEDLHALLNGIVAAPLPSAWARWTRRDA